MMQRRPAANGKALGLERVWNMIGESRLEVHHVTNGMKAWPVNGISGALAFVEYARHDLDERAAKTRAAGGPRRKR